MNTTPNASRKQIALIGKTNSGKSSLLNALVGQEVSLVSAVKGTTTDPVLKPLELLPYGPVVFIDTAGLDDQGELGQLRVQKTLSFLKRADYGIYVAAANELDEKIYRETSAYLEQQSIPYLVVITKTDLASVQEITQLKETYPQALLTSAATGNNIAELKKRLISALAEGEQEPVLVGDLVPSGGRVLLVVPVDSGAPKGRLILPQAQLIRDCLDHGLKCYVVRNTELKEALTDLPNVYLVVTDSQIFRDVGAVVPTNIFLTSFSILFARQKGDLPAFVKGAAQIANLKEGARILLAESCSHNHTHQDIGRIKLPALLEKFTGRNLSFDFRTGHDFPEDLTDYDLVIHCGACMFNRKAMLGRVKQCYEQQVSITNYGVALAFLNGILQRSLEVFS